MAAISCFCFTSLPSSCMPPPRCVSLPQARSGKLPCSRRSKIPSVKCSSNPCPSSGIQRRFHPSVWKEEDFVSSPATDSESDALRLNELKKEVKNMLFLAAMDPFQELELVNNIQRLGVAYHFVTQIKDILDRSYNQDYAHFFGQNDHHFQTSADLYHVALRFRLLRQAGYYVSPVVFNRFKDEKGEFHKKITSDVQGILSLFEASHISLNGEDIMDDAMSFTTELLKSMVTHSSHFLVLQIQRALEKPLHKSTEREQARHYISIYHHDIFVNQNLLEFAKLDYNSVQLLHQKELRELFKWWDLINFKENMPFDLRDRVAEAYVMTISWNFEPQFLQGRIHLAKMWNIYSILDDAYEGWDNIHDLTKLTDAFQRWDIRDANELIYPLKVVFLEVIKFFDDIKSIMIGKGHSIGIDYLKKELQTHIKGLYEETKMFRIKDLPTLEKYLSVALRTITFSNFLVIAVMNLDEPVTKEIFDWIISVPKILKSSSLIQRILDDIADYEVEKAEGFLISSVTCYMNDHKVSESQAIESLQRMIMVYWKDHNQELLKGNNPLPMPAIKFLLNVARNMLLYYSNGDGYTISSGQSKTIITSLLIDRIPI